MSPSGLHIAILDCDTPVPNVYAERGLYSNIFAALLEEAASKTFGLPELDLRFAKYDCVLGQLPSEEHLLHLDAVIITGSAASAYDPAPWILALVDFTRHIYNSYPYIKIFGSCFGHQVLCHALFSLSSAPVVSRDPAGWELGIHPITLSHSFLTHFGPVMSNSSSPSQLRLQFVHADHVVLSPSQLQSEDFEIIGRSAHCALQGVWKRGRVLTYQGHAEFDEFVNRETLKVFGKPIWSEEFFEGALKNVAGQDDALWAASVMLRFFMEREVVDNRDLESEGVEVKHEEDVMARL